MPAERRLAAILFTDMVGSTALMARNEEEGLQAKRRHRELVQAEVTLYRGEFIEAVGDETLSIFGSALEAATCALAIASATEREDFKLHIAIHSGDIVVADGEVHGDGVNIAARLLPLSNDGKVCVSAELYHAIRNHPEIEATPHGELDLKNVGRPIQVYSIQRRDTPAAAVQREAPNASHASGPRRTILVAVAGVFAFVGLIAWWWLGAVPESVPVPPPIRSIAVLPLQNLSGDPEQEYFADGVTEDLIGALAGISALRVPSHRSVLRFKGTTESLPQIAAELGVDAVIEGSVRRVGDQVRITVQLVKGSTDEHIWHQSYDEDLREILALQTRIARSVADRVKVTLTAGETERLTTERFVVPAAYDAYVRARQIERVRYGFAAPEMIELLERAVELDPNFVSAHVWLAGAYWGAAVYNYAPAKEQAPKARAHAMRALELGGVEVNVTLGWVASFYD